MRNDFTTTPGDPPQFEAIAALPENQGRDLRYPYSRNEAPAINPLPVPGLNPDAGEVLAKVEQVARAMADWDIVAVNQSRLKLEAVATTSLFKFKDDVILRIEDLGGRCVVTGESRSRVGKADLGQNPRNLRRIFVELDAVLAN